MALALGYAAAGFLLAGFSETFTPVFCAVFALVWYYRRQRAYLLVIAGLIVGTIVVLLAPGNAARASQLPPRTSVMVAVSIATYETLLFLKDAFTQQLAGAALAFLIGYLCPLKHPLRKRFRAAVLIPLVMLAVMIFSLALPIYATHALAPRHFTLCAFVLAVGLFMEGVLCAKSRLQLS